MDVAAVAEAGVVDDEEGGGWVWHFFHFADDGVFVVDMNNNTDHDVVLPLFVNGGGLAHGRGMFSRKKYEPIGRQNGVRPLF